jgi:protein-disulfide isomerase
VKLPLQRRAVLLAALALLAAGPAAAAPTGDHELGNPKAPVTVVEYASASCPHCARFNNDVFPAFKKKYIDTGKVHYVLREVLTEPSEVAAAGFLLANCAGQGGYFATLDRFFHAQAEIYESGDAPKVLYAVGAQSGLPKAKVDACLTDKAALKALNDRTQVNAALNTQGFTPAFFIDGNPLPPSTHETDIADLDAAIQPLLGPKRRR